MRIRPGNGVSFIDLEDELNKVHTFNDYSLVMEDHSISFPTPKTFTVDIPNRNGSIDITEALGPVKYNNRTITIVLVDKGFSDHNNAVFAQLAKAINGKRKKIIFDEDNLNYYEGRVSCGVAEKDGLIARMTITCDCEPFKKSIVKTSDPWLWDTFNFYNGVITQGGAYTISGTTTVIENPGEIVVSPTFICNSAMTLRLRGEVFSLKAGSNMNYDIILLPGRNELTFTGNGTVTIEYRSGTF